MTETSTSTTVRALVEGKSTEEKAPRKRKLKWIRYGSYRVLRWIEVEPWWGERLVNYFRKKCLCGQVGEP